MDIDRTFPKEPISPVGRRALLIIGSAILFEGFDIQVVGFTAPAILTEWRLAKSALGPTMAAALLGMMFGSPVGGWFGDRVGRRPMLISCIGLFAIATLLTVTARSLMPITGLRLLAGIGFGAALSNATAMAAEWVPRSRSLQMVGLVIIGVPAGGVLGAALCSWLIPLAGWRAAFAAAGLLPLCLTVAMVKWLPESPRYLASRGLEHSHPNVGAMRQLLASGLWRSTVCLAIAFFSNLAVSYALFSWIPLLLTTLQFQQAIGVRAALWSNLLGTLGAAAGLRFMTGSSARAIPLLYAGLGAAAAMALLLVVTRHGRDDFATVGTRPLLAGVALLGLGTSGAQMGLYALATRVYPTSCRASGVGVAGAFGRAGGLLSAFAGGTILGLTQGPTVFLALIGAFFLLCGVAILALGHDRTPDPQTQASSSPKWADATAEQPYPKRSVLR